MRGAPCRVHSPGLWARFSCGSCISWFQPFAALKHVAWLRCAHHRSRAGRLDPACNRSTPRGLWNHEIREKEGLRVPAAPSRDDSVGSVVLARSACANPSSFARYGPGTGPRLDHSWACTSICFAITSLQRTRYGLDLPNVRRAPRRTSANPTKPAAASAANDLGSGTMAPG